MSLRCLSNANICDVRRGMASIRGSSLISITLGLLTVIGACLRSLSLKRRHSRQRFAEIETNFRERAGAGRPVVMRWRLGPARFGSYFYRTSSTPASGLERCDGLRPTMWLVPTAQSERTPARHVSPCGRGLFLGSHEQIFGADKQGAGRGQGAWGISGLRGAGRGGPNFFCRPALATAPAKSGGWGLFAFRCIFLDNRRSVR